jgi:ribosomal protein L31E
LRRYQQSRREAIKQHITDREERQHRSMRIKTHTNQGVWKRDAGYVKEYIRVRVYNEFNGQGLLMV